MKSIQSIGLCLLIALVSGCGNDESDNKLSDLVTGKWECYRSESEGRDLLEKLPQNPVMDFGEDGIEKVSGEKWEISDSNLVLSGDRMKLQFLEGRMMWKWNSANGSLVEQNFRPITEEEYRQRPDLNGIIHIEHLGYQSEELGLEEDIKMALQDFLIKQKPLAVFADKEFILSKNNYLLVPLWTKEGLKFRDTSQWKESRKGNGGDLRIVRVNGGTRIEFFPWNEEYLSNEQNI